VELPVDRNALDCDFGLHAPFRSNHERAFGADLSYFFASFSGIVAGMMIGFTAYYYTSGKSVENLAKASTTGSATKPGKERLKQNREYSKFHET
jgi:hypothetical protein